MSIENKFRAWNIEKKIMCYDNEDESTELWDGAYGSEVGMINFHLNMPEHLKTYEYMQYIGVKDNNGKEIYDGDIVSQYADCTELGKSLYFFYVIEWSEEYCGFVGRDIYSNEIYLMPDLKDIEVIGNVYENADLLKEAGNE